MYYSQELLVPIWPGLALYIRSWDFGAALPWLSRLQQPPCIGWGLHIDLPEGIQEGGTESSPQLDIHKA